MTTISCDVCLVGSGAGGATAAYALARAGADVVVLEKGPFYSLADFRRDELAVCRRDFFVPFVSEEPILMRHSADGPFRKTNNGWTACCVGGGTVHMSGYFLRLHEEDFRARSELGAIEGADVVDWPFSYETLAPYYDRVEALLGVSGLDGQNPFDAPRAFPYPLPPLLDHPAAAHLDRVLREKGWHPFVTPRAVLSRPYDGRPCCTYSGFCGNYGCETAAKSSALATMMPKAIATGRCRVLPRHIAAEVSIDKHGRATAVRAIDAKGQSVRVEARAVCLAAGALQSARILLNSRSGRFPRGLANDTDEVGRHLVFSSFSHVEAEFLNAGGGGRIPEWDDRLPWIGRSLQDFYQFEHEGARLKGGTIRFDFVHPNPIFNAERAAIRGGRLRWGSELKRAIRRRIVDGRTMEAEIFGEFLPTPETRVEVDPTTPDRFGIPAAKVTLAQHPRDHIATRFLADRAREAFEAMGADSVDTVTSTGATYVLQGGTCRAGADPATSVLDPDCRAHAVDNLYVVDGSFLPSSGGVPITLTIHANALRVAEQLASRFTRRDL